MEKQSLRMDSKQLIKIILCLSVILLFWVLPPLEPITTVGMRTIGVFIGTVLLLSLVDTLWPVLLSFALLSLTGVMSLNEVLAGSLGNWIITFVMASLVLTFALNNSGFTSRLTAYYMTRKFVNKSPWRFTVAYWAIGFIVGLFMDQVAATAFFLGFTAKILDALGYSKKDRYSQMMIMGIVFAINIGGAATPISHSLVLLGMGIYEQAVGESISMFDYMAYAMPACLALFALMSLVMRFLFKVDTANFKDFDVEKALGSRKPMDLREKVTVTVFFGTVFFWVLPGFMGLFFPADAPIMIFLSKFPITFWALLAVVILAVLRIDNEPVVNLKDSLENGFPWGIILFISIGVLLGSAVSKDAVGLNEFIMVNMTPLLESIPTYAIVFVFALATTVVTNFASNVTTITIMTGVAITLAASTQGLNPIALATTTTMCGCLAFVMPSSFGTIALLHADEHSDSNTIIRYGVLMVLLSSLAATFIGYPLLAMMAP